MSDFRDGRTRATLRILGVDLDPAAVSTRVGMEPTESWRQGDLIGRGSSENRRPMGGWLLASDWEESDDLNVVLDRLIGVTERFSTELRALRSESASVDVSAYWESCVSAGPWLEPSVMGRLAALGLPLLVDVYKTDDET